MAFTSLFASTTAENLNIFAPVSPPAKSISHLFLLVVAITGFIFVVVEGVLIYSLIRFRRKPGDDKNEPPQVYGSMPIEIAWTAGPALIVFLLILVLLRTVLEIRVDQSRPPPGSQPLYVTVVGHQWWWEYRYETYDGKELGFVTANELHMPASDDETPRPVYLTLLSADVVHSYWIPRLAGKIDLIPGRTNHLWFQTNKTGLYLGQCADFCGTQHAHMLLRAVVETPEEFAKWAANEKKTAVDSPAVRDDSKVFFSQSCVSCHTIRLSKADSKILPSRADGKFGPDLTHLMSRQTLAAGMIPNNKENLRQWVADPQKIKPGCLMPSFGLSDQKVDAIVNYLRTLD
jgi:cytochrome c oxidase subunit 2